jgi:hypothetical protein
MTGFLSASPPIFTAISGAAVDMFSSYHSPASSQAGQGRFGFPLRRCSLQNRHSRVIVEKNFLHPENDPLDLPPHWKTIIDTLEEGLVVPAT